MTNGTVQPGRHLVPDHHVDLVDPNLSRSQAGVGDVERNSAQRDGRLNDSRAGGSAGAGEPRIDRRESSGRVRWRRSPACRRGESGSTA